MGKYYKLFLLISVLFNCVVISAFIYLKYIKYPSYYRDTVKLVSNENPEDASVILLGDSFIAKYNWPVFSSALKTATFGLGGSDIRRLYAGKDEYLALKADTIIIWAGINDLFYGRGLDSLIYDYKNLTSMLENHGKTVYSISVLQLKNDQFRNNQSVNSMVGEFNRFLKSSYKTIDLFESCDNNLLTAIYDDDGIHLSEMGYRIADANLTRAIFCESK